MAITVTMIEEKEFSRKARGYDEHEVDEFLDEICDEMVNMQREIAALQQRNQQLQNQQKPSFTPSVIPAPVSPSIPVPAAAPAFAVPVPEKKKEDDESEKNIEAALEVLRSARRVYDETVEEAKKKAEQILQDAREISDGKLERLESDKKAALEEIEMLKASVKDYRRRFLRLMEDQQHLLNTDNVLFDEKS